MLPRPSPQSQMPNRFKPSVIRLQRPFNQQGAQLTKTLFLSDILYRQVTRQFLGDFIFSFVTNVNLQRVIHPIMMNILSMVFFLLLLIFGTFLDWKYNGNKFTEVPKGLEKAFHPSIFDTPSSIFLTAPFYIQGVISIVSLIAYVGMFHFYYLGYIATGFNMFFQYICNSLCFPFCLFSVTNALYSIILICKSNSINSNLFLINIILSIFCFPALLFCMYCSYSDIRISSLPFTNINPGKTETWFFLCFFFCFFETLLFNLNHNYDISNYWVCVFLMVISFIMTAMTIYNPFFLNLYSKIMATLTSSVLFVVSFFSFVQSFVDNVYLPTASFIVSCIVAVASIIYHILQYIRINKQIKKNDTIELTKESQFYNYYSYCNYKQDSNLGKLATKELFESFKTTYPTNFCIQILILRYLNYIHNSSAVFEISVHLLKILTTHFYFSIQLTELIEQSSDIVRNSRTATNYRDQQLDNILEQCISSELEFWRAILLDRPNHIAENAVRLYDNVENAKNFFKQLGINENTNNQYGVKYVDFLMNIAVDFTQLEKVGVDSTKPIPYDQRFQMHQPRRDTKNSLISATTTIKAQQSLPNPQIDSDLASVTKSSSQMKPSSLTPRGKRPQLFHHKNSEKDNNNNNNNNNNNDNNNNNNDNDDVETSNESTKKVTFPSFQDSNTSDNLEAFPSLDVEGQKRALISQDRIELCKSTKEKKLKGENFRIIAFLIYSSLIALLSLILFVLVAVHHDKYLKKIDKVEEMHLGIYEVFNCSVALLNYKTSQFYRHDFPVPREFVESCIESSYYTILHEENIGHDLNTSMVDDLYLDYTRFLNYKATTPGNLVTSQPFFDISLILTKLAYTYLSTLQNIINDISEDTEEFHKLTKNLIIWSSVIFAILIPFFIATFVSLYFELKNLFWQPLLIEKAEAANVFRTFLHISSPERRKSNMRSEQFMQNKKTKSFLFSKFSWTLGSIVFYFVLQYIIMEGFLLVMHREISNFAGLSFSYGNCSTVMTYLTTNLYRFVPLGYTNDSFKYNNWFLKAIQAFRDTVTDRRISADNGSLSNIINSIEVPYYYVPTVNQTLARLETLDLFPLPYPTLNQLFFHSIMSTFMVMGETFIANESSTSITRMKDLVHSASISDPFFNKTFSIYHDDVIIYQFLAIFVMILLIILQGLILYLAIMKQFYIRRMIHLFIRTIILLPDKTPLVRPGENEITFFDKMPDSPTMKMIESLPVGFIMTDKNGVIKYSNPKAAEYFGSGQWGGIQSGTKVSDLSDHPQMRYFSITQRNLSQFPSHPFDRKLPKNEYYHYYVYNDTTELNLNKLENQKLQTELKEMRRQRLPSSLTVTRKGQKQNVIMMDNFAMVEAEISRDMPNEVFAKVKQTLQNEIDSIPTVFISEFFRDSIVIVFSSFNVQSHQRQFLRDALHCAELVSDACKDGPGAKVAVTSGKKCICKITDHELARVSFYAPLMTKAAMLLRFGVEGDIIIEWNIMKIIYGLDTNVEKVGSGLICNKDIDYCILQRNDNLLKQLFGNVSTTNVLFS